MQGHHHLSKHKRTEPYPSERFWFRILDSIVYVAGVLGPLFTLPQIIQIYSTHQAAGVSALSFFMWALLDIPWIVYGAAHKERPIVYTYTLWFVANTIVVVGALIYQ